MVRRRSKPAMPTNPVPRSPKVPGSGTVGGVLTGVPDCEKFVTKFPPPPFTQPMFPWLLSAVADVLQTSNWTLYVGPFDGVPVKLKVRVSPLPATPTELLTTAQPQLPVPPHCTAF